MARWMLIGCAALGACCHCFAGGQPSFEPRGRFALGHGDHPTPLGGPLVIGEPGVYDLTIQVGVFDAEGFTNHGTGAWIGSLASTGARFEEPGVWSFVVPFDYGVAAPPWWPMQGELVEPTLIEGIEAIRVGERTPPPGPGPYGAEEYVGVYRFRLLIDDVSTPRELTISAAGSVHALTGWVMSPPEPGIPPEEERYYRPEVTILGRAIDASLTVRVVPAPWSAAVFGAGLLAATRRRGRCAGA